MEYKTCKYCKKAKLINDFEIANIFNGKKYRRLKCKRCYQDTKNKWRQGKRDWLVELKKTYKCKYCGINDFRVLDFHHNDSKDKVIEIANTLHCWSKKRILTEIAKCEILCANCHRILHYDQRQKNKQGIA